MIDLVDRQQIVQEAWWLYNDQVGDYYGQVVDLDVVLDAPTVDAVEVVRCGKCIHRHESEFCECRSEDWFCADGDRKEAAE